MGENPPKSTHQEAEQVFSLDNHSIVSQIETQEEALVQQYQQRRALAESALEVLKRKKADNERLLTVKESLGIKMGENSQDSIHEANVDELEAEVVASQASYPGHWTLLLQERLKDSDIRQKFIDTRTEAFASLNEGEAGPHDKPKQFRSHYESQIENYDENIESVFSHTQIGNAAEYARRSTSAGTGNIGEPGVVFSDAASRESGPLTTRQKIIIEAHEKGHGIRDFQGSDAAEVRSVLDYNVLKERQDLAVAEDPQNRFANYLRKPEEIIERMAQLKNYFGFRGSESFTKKHLDYAREHYIADTGLDNNMSPFFAAITPETENQFLTVMNKYPI